MTQEKCDISERIESARNMLIEKAKVLKVAHESVEYSELRYDQNGNRYIARHKEPDYRYREIPLAVLHTRTCEIRIITITRTIPKDNQKGIKERRAQGVIIDGPVSEQISKYARYVWWRIAFKEGDTAWTAEHLLRRVARGAFERGTAIEVNAAKINIRAAPGLRPMPDSIIGVDDSRFTINLEARYFGKAWMAYNTPLSIAPHHWIPIGIIWKKHKENIFSHYVPFSTALYREYLYLRITGQEHLDGDLQEAFRRLQERGVASRALPDRLVSRVIAELFFDLLRALPLLEQTDAYEMDQYLEGELGYDPFMRVQVIVGANGNRAFSLSRSGANAVGITQIWEPTCESLRVRYPDAGLPRLCGYTSDYDNHGHIYSFMASILHLDVELERLIDHFGVGVLRDPELIRKGAAGYNGDIARVVRAIKRFENTWHIYHGKRYLAGETLGYIEKLDYLMRHLEILNPK